VGYVLAGDCAGDCALAAPRSAPCSAWTLEMGASRFPRSGGLGPLTPGCQLLPPATPPANLPGTIPGTTGTVTVSRVEVVGSTVFSEEELATLTQPFLNRPLN
jgi:hemolysin activation/secretion protein